MELRGQLSLPVHRVAIAVVKKLLDAFQASDQPERPAKRQIHRSTVSRWLGLRGVVLRRQGLSDAQVAEAFRPYVVG